MKKKSLLTAILIALVLFSITFVLAPSHGPTGQNNFDVWSRNIASGFSNLFEGIQLGTVNFTLILFGILLWMIIYSVIRNIDLFKKYRSIWSAIFALVVTILAFRGFPEAFIEGIVIQYQAMGATIITVIPFLIILWFTIAVSSSLMVSRLIWLVYTVYYFSLFVFKIGSGDASVGTFSAQNLPYIGAIIIGLVVLIYLGAIRAWAFKEKLDTKKEKAERKVKKAGAGLDAAADIIDELGG